MYQTILILILLLEYISTLKLLIYKVYALREVLIIFYSHDSFYIRHHNLPFLHEGQLCICLVLQECFPIWLGLSSNYLEKMKNLYLIKSWAFHLFLDYMYLTVCV